MASKEEGISITGESGLQAHLSKLMQMLSGHLTASLVLKLYQYGRPSPKLLMRQTENMNLQSFYPTKNTAVDLVL